MELGDQNNHLTSEGVVSNIQLGTPLAEAIEKEVDAALKAAGIHEIGCFGWLNENDVDPDYIGHAMWQTDQPQLDLHSLFEGLPNRRPPDIEKLILTVGEDFCALMQVSRLSLGLSLLWQPKAARDVLNDNQFFWLHHTDTFLKMAIASDRLRDLLVLACTGGEPGCYKNLHRHNRRYVTPFSEAENILVNRGITDERALKPTVGLSANALKIFSYIDRRNEIVHSIATRMARTVHGNVAKLQSDYDSQVVHGLPPKQDRSEWMPIAEARMQELRCEIQTAADELKEWYLLLIDTSNLVFQVEHWARKLSAGVDP